MKSDSDAQPFLHHLIKEVEKNEPYQFQKLNKTLNTFMYTDQEYRDIITKLPSTKVYQSRRLDGKVDGSEDWRSNVLIQKWSRPDTDLLFKLADQYQLRFIVMTDRFNFEKEQDVRATNERREKQKQANI